MKQTCLLVLGGEIRDKDLFRRRLDEAELILAADSGARHMLALGRMPEQVFGDLDSLTPEEIEQLQRGGCRFETSPREKNDTDSSIILKEALSRGYMDIRMWGALGRRPDHSYANLILLQFVHLPVFMEIYGNQEKNQPDVVIEDGGVRIFLAKRGQWIEGKPGEYLSFFALTSQVTGFAQKGLKYQPAGDRYVRGYPVGVSNEFVDEKVWINWDKGMLLCMHVDGAVFHEEGIR